MTPQGTLAQRVDAFAQGATLYIVRATEQIYVDLTNNLVLRST